MPISTNKFTTEGIQAAALNLGVDIPTIKTLIAVEARGKCFLEDKMPLVQYERHLFYRSLVQKRTKAAQDEYRINNPSVSKVIADVELAAIARRVKQEVDLLAINNPGIVNQLAGGYKGGATEYLRTELATRIDAEVAASCISIGAFYIPVWFYRELGFETAQSMVEKMTESPDAQLQLYIQFLMMNRNMVRAIQQKNWRQFAQLKCGSDQAVEYGDRLSSTYNTLIKLS